MIINEGRTDMFCGAHPCFYKNTSILLNNTEVLYSARIYTNKVLKALSSY